MDKVIREIIRKILEEKLENQNTFIIRKFKKEDREQVMILIVNAFSHLMPENEILTYIDSVTNYNKSIVVDKDNEIIGFYLLGDRQLRDGVIDENANKIYVNLNEYDKKTGIEGVALMIKETERGSGLGSKLKDYTKKLGVDYVWGIQYKGLGNLQKWLRRRILAAESDETNITVENLK